MMKRLYTLLAILCLIHTGSLHAQRERDNWYFGHNAGIIFTGNPTLAGVVSNSAMQSRASACISDAATGQLLFYTSGESVWNKNHALMPNGTGLINAPIANGTLIVPYPGKSGQYFIFTVNPQRVLSYSIVDVTMNGGLGEVTSKNNFVANDIAHSITAVKHAVNNSYWLITHSSTTPANNNFFIFPVTESGLQNPPQTIPMGLPGQVFGDMASNAKGDKIAITHYADTTKAFAQVFEFDKLCGRPEKPITLHKETAWDYAYGICFSPDDTKLYIAYSYMQSQVVQYSGANWANWAVAATDAQNLNNLMNGPDGKMYITTHDNSIPSPIIDVIEFPNNPAATCSYKQNQLHLGGGRNSNFEFPNFLNDNSQPKPGGGIDGVGIVAANTCLGDTVRFSISGTMQPDSVRWNFNDPNSTNNISTLTAPSHFFSQPGNYVVGLNWYRCGYELVMVKRITIAAPQPVTLGPDTLFCYGDTITISPNITTPKILWSTGDTTPALTVTKGGKYSVQVFNGSCSGADTIEVQELPPILIDIGDEYTICDDGTELVQLDAGKGYKHYLWTPTGDTTQWIIVKAAGEHFVVVEDYRGCKGDDGAKVLRQCDFTFYIPNSFTPNGDGKNDVFGPVFTDVTDYNIEIYNLWGELIYRSDDPAKGWDGMYKGSPAPIGAYVWQLRFKGFHNKLLRNYNHNGVVSLLR